VNADTKARMKDVLTDIQTGAFAKGWILENQANRPQFNAINRAENNHQIEQVGRELRALMPFIKKPVTTKKEVVVNGSR
jgi:ketol-acid reductoisomerase